MKMKKLKTFENWTNNIDIKSYFKNFWSKDKLLRFSIQNSSLFGKYEKYLNSNFNWDSLNDDDLKQLWIDWDNDEIIIFNEITKK
jgi:hypothetical protein